MPYTTAREARFDMVEPAPDRHGLSERTRTETVHG
jgi:hypothetical protein